MPFLVKNIDIEATELDFRASGQGKLTYSALKVNSETIFNAMELSHYENGRMQAIVCAGCGIQGCEDGGWVSIRRFDEYILILPYQHSADHWRRSVIDSSGLFNKQGVPAFSKDHYETLKTHIKSLPDYFDVAALTKKELLLMFQLEAPRKILGHIGSSIRAKPDYFLTALVGDTEFELRALNRLLKNFDDDAVAEVPNGFDAEVEFVLDLPNYPHWVPFGYKDGRAYLNICFNN